MITTLIVLLIVCMAMLFVMCIALVFLVSRYESRISSLKDELRRSRNETATITESLKNW